MAGASLVAIAAPGCPGPSTCITGASQACTCTNGSTGAQVCRADGTFDRCVCESLIDAGQPDAPSATDARASDDAPSTTDAPSTVDASTDAGAGRCPTGTACDCPGGVVGYCESRDMCRCDPGPVPCAQDVDWLFLVDTSNSMAEEQVALASEIPRLVRVLATGDADGDGTSDFAPVRSLHLGVVTPDLGTSPVTGVPTCDSGFGDDGILRRTPHGAGCPSVDYPSAVFEFVAGGAVTPDAFAADFACVAQAGTGGCGFEQQLEAPLRALSPSSPTAWTRPGYVPVTFRDGSSGQALGPNAGFLRSESVLALTLVTDEEDCSVPDTSLFSFDDPRYSAVGLNLRCTTFTDALYPTSRYVSGLLGLRPHPGLLVYSAITGIPDAPFADYDALLAHPDMSYRVDPALGERLLPVCTSATGSASPARRMVEVARELDRGGVQTSVSSICASSFETAVSDVVRALIAARTSC